MIDKLNNKEEEDAARNEQTQAIVMERLHEQWMKEERERQKRALEQGEEYNIVVRYPEHGKQSLPEQWAKQDIERRKRAALEQQGKDEWNQY